MLAVGHDRGLIEPAWKAAEAKVQLPDSWRASFFEKSGPMALHHENRRNYHRYFVRVKTVIKHGGKKYGGYTMDISREGVGLLSPVQFLPQDLIELQLPHGYALPLVVVRCKYLATLCFECGAKFAFNGIPTLTPSLE